MQTQLFFAKYRPSKKILILHKNIIASLGVNIKLTQYYDIFNVQYVSSRVTTTLYIENVGCYMFEVRLMSITFFNDLFIGIWKCNGGWMWWVGLGLVGGKWNIHNNETRCTWRTISYEVWSSVGIYMKYLKLVGKIPVTGLRQWQ